MRHQVTAPVCAGRATKPTTKNELCAVLLSVKPSIGIFSSISFSWPPPIRCFPLSRTSSPPNFHHFPWPSHTLSIRPTPSIGPFTSTLLDFPSSLYYPPRWAITFADGFANLLHLHRLVLQAVLLLPYQRIEATGLLSNALPSPSLLHKDDTPLNPWDDLSCIVLARAFY